MTTSRMATSQQVDASRDKKQDQREGISVGGLSQRCVKAFFLPRPDLLLGIDEALRRTAV